MMLGVCWFRDFSKIICFVCDTKLLCIFDLKKSRTYVDCGQRFFFNFEKNIMSFIYDSLDTVKKMKFPTKKEFINLTIAIFVVVIIA